MKTKTINIFEVQQRWIRWHLSNADAVECDAQTGEALRAIYHAPIAKWKGFYQPDGTLLVPDMEYYNGLTNLKEMQDVIDELKL